MAHVVNSHCQKYVPFCINNKERAMFFMALLASFQRKFDALECTVDITYSIRLNEKVWGRIICRKKWMYEVS